MAVSKEPFILQFTPFIRLLFCPQFTTSMTGTLEKGAHHQALDLSEELPPHHHHHHNSHHQHLHQCNSLGSTTAVGGGRETPSRVVVPPPYSAAESGGGGSEGPLELRGSLDCWACSVLVTAQNLIIATINACLAGLVFGTVLTPAIVMVTFGFLCHSTVREGGWVSGNFEGLQDAGCRMRGETLPMEPTKGQVQAFCSLFPWRWCSLW